MASHIILDPEVYEDLQHIIDWYNGKQRGLGERFYKLFKQEVKTLKTRAFHYQVRYDGTRAVQIQPFPYMIHYSVIEEQETVFVEAVIGTNTDPNKWRTKS